MQASEPVYLNNKLIGWIKGDVYITRRTREHFFRIFKGFALSEAVIHKLLRRGVTRIIIIYTNDDGSEVLFKSSLEQWLEADTWTDTSMGFQDEQRVLPVIEMEVEGEGTPDFWQHG